MRVLLAGAIMALLIASPAAAQDGTTPAAAPPPSACGELPARPTLPDGATASRQQIEAANTTYIAWSTAFHANLQCRRAESEAARATWQARVSEYNAGAGLINEANTAWEAEVAEFNARGDNEADEIEDRQRRIR